MVSPQLYSSASDEWETPEWLFRASNAEFGFTLDPCSTHANAKCKKHFTRAENGLAQDWSDEIVWMNPPYGREIYKWMEKAYRESLRGSTVVALVPSRTCTKWWHFWAMRGEIRLLRGRVKFVGGKHSAPFPSALVIFRPPGHRIVPAGLWPSNE